MGNWLKNLKRKFNKNNWRIQEIIWDDGMVKLKDIDYLKEIYSIEDLKQKASII